MDTQAIGLACLRILAGVGMLRHGAMKVFGGGMEGFTEGVAGMGFPLPALFAWAGALAELVGGLCLAIGFGTRVAAFFIGCTMSVALFIRHAGDPIHVKELAYLYWTVSLAVLFLGGGRYTFEYWLVARRTRARVS